MKHSSCIAQISTVWNLSLCTPLFVAVCMHKFFIQGWKSAQAHPNNHCHAHTVDHIHGLGQGWAGGGNVGEVAKDPDKRGRKADFRFVYPPGRARVLDSRGGVYCFIFIMAAVQTEVSLCSQPWQRPFYIYGGLACNSLMAGKFFSLSLWPIRMVFVVFSKIFVLFLLQKILMYL